MDRGGLSVPDTPEEILNALRDNPNWSESAFDEAFDRLIQSADLQTLESIAVRRLGDLSQNDGEAILRLIESIGSDDLLTALGHTLLTQGELSAERDWQALSILADAERLGEWPDLAERFTDLVEIFEEAGASSVEDWASTLQDDPDGVWVALHGLAMVEPEVRPSIVSSLVGVPLNPGLVEFLEVLAEGPDLELGRAAREVLEAAPSREDKHVAHGRMPETLEKRPNVKSLVARCLVTDLDGDGKGRIIISTFRDLQRIAIFECDVHVGIARVQGAETDEDQFDLLAKSVERSVVIDHPELTLALLAGVHGINPGNASSEFTEWTTRLLGRPLDPRPFPGAMHGFDPSTVPHLWIPAMSAKVLAAMPGWVDRSPLTTELAAELKARNGDAGVNQSRDAGAFRYLFEHRLVHRLETYRRMLFWMAAFWQALKEIELAKAALALAYQLSDPQHAVAANAFVVELTRRSLLAAMA